MELDRAGIEALLPHRHPFLFLDRATVLEVGSKAEAWHDVPQDAFWVPGHFPTQAILPGVLLAEAMAQCAALAYLAGDADKAGKAVYLVGYDKLRFRKPVRPGDSVRLVATLERARRSMVTFQVEAFVGEDRAANGTLIAAMGE